MCCAGFAPATLVIIPRQAGVVNHKFAFFFKKFPNRPSAHSTAACFQLFGPGREENSVAFFFRRHYNESVILSLEAMRLHRHAGGQAHFRAQK